MIQPDFEAVSSKGFNDCLSRLFLDALDYYKIEKDPDDRDPDRPDAWRMVVPIAASVPYAIAYKKDLSGMDRRAVSRLYIERVIPHRDGTPSVVPALYGFTDGARYVFYSADPARNRDDRFDLSQNTWAFHVVQDKFQRLHRDRLELKSRLGKLRPVVDFLFEGHPLSADERFKRYVHFVRADLMRGVLEERKALGAVIYHLLETPEAREHGKTRFVTKEYRLKKSIDDLHLEIGSRLGDAVGTAVDTLLLRYIMIRFLETYHPEAMDGLLRSRELLIRGKGGKKDEKGNLIPFGSSAVRTAAFTDTELELARRLTEPLGIDVSRAKRQARGQDTRTGDLFIFEDESALAATVLSEEQKRQDRLGGDFYLADLGRAAQTVEETFFSRPKSKGAKLLQDFLGRTGAPEMAQWDFRYEDLRPQALQDYYESSLGTAVQLTWNERTKEFEVAVGKTQRQRKELGAYYTDSRLCRFMVERTLKPLFEERLEALRKAVSSKDFDSAKRAFKRIVELTICDPTMGSAPFLRSAFDYLSEQYLPLCRAIADARTSLPALFDEVSKDFPFLASKGGVMDEDGVGRWEWHILRRMLYGVDIDLKAVCIACQTFALSALKYLRQGERFPSFFNINLKLGNALISPLQVADRAKLATDSGKAIAELIRLRRDAMSLPNTEKAYERLAALLKDTGEIKGPIVRDLVQERIAPILEEFTEEMRPFCWELEFPEVFFNSDGSLKEHAGFDVVIGNPPWEAIKFNDDEFLTSLGLDPSTDVDELCNSDKTIRDSYQHYRAVIEKWKDVVASEAYQHQQGGRDRNFWRLAVEVSWKLTGPRGHVSLVVPSGIIGDEGALALKQMLFGEGIVGPFISFEKENAVFPGTQGFTIYSATKGGVTESLSHIEGLRSATELESLPSTLEIPLSLAIKMSPLTLTIPSIQNQIDLDILRKLYSHPVLGEAIDGCWKFTPYTAEIHMGHDRRRGRITERETTIPLLTGESIADFEVRFRDPHRLWVKPAKFTLPEAAQTERVVWRNVVGTSDPRRMVVSLCPKDFAVGHSLNYVLPEQPLAVRLFLVGTLNSFVVEWRARQISRNNNMVHFVLKQLPMPRLQPGSIIFDQVVKLSGALLAASPEFRHLERKLDVKAIRAADQRVQGKAHIDAVVAHAYGLTRGELGHILSRFDAVPDQTRQLVLAEFDQLRS